MSSADAVKRTLLAVKTFARNEGAESGMHMLRVFERLGIVEEMKAKTIAMPVNTGYVAQLVADRKVEMAAQQMPELHAVAGVAPTPLPPELQMIIPFSAGVSSTTRQRRSSRSAVAIHDIAGGRRGAQGQRPASWRSAIVHGSCGAAPRRASAIGSCVGAKNPGGSGFELTGRS